MTIQEFNERDSAIQQEISNYRIQSAEMRAQINYNEREIIKLEMERVLLRKEYVREPSVL